MQAALDVVRSGELGRLVSLTSLAPHRLNRALRPSWFFDRDAYGGIINDIGVHSIDQFLAFADTPDATIVASTIGCFGTPPHGFEDFAEITLRSHTMTGTMRLDWFTPDGLPDWGDGRLFLVGTEGTLELRKNLDIEGRPGGDHHVRGQPSNERVIRTAACLPVTYYGDFLDDVRSRTGAMMEEGRVFVGLPAGVAVPGGGVAVHAVTAISVRPIASTLRRSSERKRHASLGRGEISAGDMEENRRATAGFDRVVVPAENTDDVVDRIVAPQRFRAGI